MTSTVGGNTVVRPWGYTVTLERYFSDRKMYVISSATAFTLLRPWLVGLGFARVGLSALLCLHRYSKIKLRRASLVTFKVDYKLC